jgi:hypothetical protein
MICDRCYEHTSSNLLKSRFTQERICPDCCRDETSLILKLREQGIQDIENIGHLPYRKEYPKITSSALFNIPNNDEGKQIIQNIKKHLNQRFRIKQRGKGHRFGTYNRDIPLDKSERIAVYIISKRHGRIID